ncbi:Major facilitator superfamily [Macrophomina phaseolina MS6]|uniref:Major facilitator superfamily n=1 Tax=Macrophomina phaseolina (strain MS6) TaxID=1126212 RepID=K2S410_MACPH|nr:Major facilitator superfamily [Macrophomina phaseolina MS6]
MGEEKPLTQQTVPVHPQHSKLPPIKEKVNLNALSSQYEGTGTANDPFVVQWIHGEMQNPLLWKDWYKWFIALSMASTTLCVSFCSSAYSGGISGIKEDLGASHELATLGLSLFVLGFGLGPLIWAPLSEMYGRRIVFFVTFGALTCFNVGTAVAPNIETIVVLRLLGGTFGSSPFTNAGGVIADIFNTRERGLAMCIFAAAPFMGPGKYPLWIVGSAQRLTEYTM